MNYRQLTANKTIRQQLQLDFVHLLNFEDSTLPSVQQTSETDSSTKSELYPPLKPLRKPSTSFSNLLETTSKEPE